MESRLMEVAVKFLTNKFVFWPLTAIILFTFSNNFRVRGLTDLRVELREEQQKSAASGVDANRSETNSVGALDGLVVAEDWSSDLTLAEKYALTRARISSDSDAADHFSLAAASEIEPIRVTTFDASRLTRGSLDQPKIRSVLTRIFGAADVVAVQGIDARSPSLVSEIVHEINFDRDRLDIIMGPAVGSGSRPSHFAFVFSKDRIETDHRQVYTVDDPQDLLQYEPLVAWFRVRGLPHDRAFTFTLVNVFSDHENVSKELSLLPAVLESVMRDGRNEDDCLLIGNFGVSSNVRKGLLEAGLRSVSNRFTATNHQADYVDCLVPSIATSEILPDATVFDFLRELNLSLGEAKAISEHLPLTIRFQPVESR